VTAQPAGQQQQRGPDALAAAQLGDVDQAVTAAMIEQVGSR